MDIFEIVVGFVLLALAVVISALVMFQSGSDSKLSGTISGGSETFFGKSKVHTRDKKLSMWTGICSVVFAVAVIVLFVIV